MKQFRQALTAFFAFMLHLTCVAAEPVTTEMITAWWAASSTERFEAQGKPIPITLTNRETAYLQKVMFSGRGRNGANTMLLARPSLKAVRDMPFTSGLNTVVYDLDRDGISEVATTGSSSGQGETDFVTHLVQFDGFEPIFLLKARTGNNLGICGLDTRPRYVCEESGLTLQVEHRSTGRQLHLVEKITYRSGRTPDQMTSNTSTRHYQLVNQKLLVVKGNAQVCCKKEVLGYKACHQCE